MKAIKIFVLEDEIVTQEVLRECLEGFGYEVCGLEDNAVDALRGIRETQPDMVMLDINVKGEHSGIWLANQLENIPFIFLTAYSDRKTISSALKTEPSSYLLKPFDNRQVYAAIEIALQSNNTLEVADEEDEVEAAPNDQYKLNDELVIRDGNNHFKISLADLMFLHADNKYTEIHLSEKKFVIRMSLTRFLQEFEDSFFVKVHKSYIVNINYVDYYDSDSLKIGAVEIPISRTNKSHFQDAMDKYRLLKSR